MNKIEETKNEIEVIKEEAEKENKLPSQISELKVGENVLISNISGKSLKSAKIVNSQQGNRMLALKVGKGKLNTFKIGEFFDIEDHAFMVVAKDPKYKIAGFLFVATMDEYNEKIREKEEVVSA